MSRACMAVMFEKKMQLRCCPFFFLFFVFFLKGVLFTIVPYALLAPNKSPFAFGQLVDWIVDKNVSSSRAGLISNILCEKEGTPASRLLSAQVWKIGPLKKVISCGMCGSTK